MTTDLSSSAVSRTGAKVWPIRLAAVFAAIVASLLVWVVIEQWIGHDLYAPVFVDPNEQAENIGVVEVISAAVIPSLLGWALLAVLERYRPRPARLWTIIACVFLVVSMPWLGIFRNNADKVSIVLLHLTVAAVIIPILAWSSSRRSDRMNRA